METPDREVIELDPEFIVLCIPADSVELDITAKVYVGQKILEVSKHMDFPEVREAIKEAQGGYIPGDALFMLAPTKREKLEALLDRYSVAEDDE